jgi:hypothetical protein
VALGAVGVGLGAGPAGGGSPGGSGGPRGAPAPTAAKQGFRFVMVSNDASLFRQAVDTLGEELGSTEQEVRGE